MRGKVVDASSLCGGFNDMPNCLRSDPSTPDFARAAYTPENCAGVDFGSREPGIDSSFNPRRDWNCADVLSFADQVGYDPVLLTDLEVLRLEADQLCPSQTT